MASHQFRHNKYNRGFLRALVPITAVCFFIVFWVIDYQSRHEVIVHFTVSALVVGLLGFAAWVVHVWQLTIDDEGVHLRTWRRTRHFFWADIKGFRRTNNTLKLEFYDAKRRPLILDTEVENPDLLLNVLGRHLTDLGLEESVAEAESLLDNPAFGDTVEERKHYLKKARKKAQTWSLVAILVGGLPLLPQPYTIELILPIIFPFVLKIVVLRSNGSIALFAPLHSQTPNVAVGLLFCIMLYNCSALIENQVLDFYLLLPPTLIIGGLYGGVLYYLSRIHRPRVPVQWSVIALLALPYGVGTGIWSNRLLAKNELLSYYVEVVDKSSSSKAIVFYDYYAHVKDWQQPDAPTLEISIKQALYDRCQIGDTLELTIKPGLWGMRWVEDVEISE